MEHGIKGKSKRSPSGGHFSGPYDKPVSLEL